MQSENPGVFNFEAELKNACNFFAENNLASNRHRRLNGARTPLTI
jgi:hypothetical protein